MIENSESVFGIKMLQKKEKRPQVKPGGQYDSLMHDHETADQASDKKSQRKRNSHSI